MGAIGPLPAGVTNHKGGLIKGHSLMMPLFGEEEGIWKKGGRENHKEPQALPAALEL